MVERTLNESNTGFTNLLRANSHVEEQKLGDDRLILSFVETTHQLVEVENCAARPRIQGIQNPAVCSVAECLSLQTLRQITTSLLYVSPVWRILFKNFTQLEKKDYFMAIDHKWFHAM
ncbi:hypothetical protein J6590_021378 [Homalodisca vitripennis]|nr:hypothetical protein J6590_021378 [Homalodisca vitripennis]